MNNFLQKIPSLARMLQNIYINIIIYRIAGVENWKLIDFLMVIVYDVMFF